MNGGASPGAPVLVVDDSPTICRDIAAILGNRGYDVTAVNSGAEALKAVRARGFHLMTLDVEMPGLAGIDVLRMVRGLAPDLVVIMVSSLSSLQVAIKAIRLGAYDYVNKPYDPEDLVLAVERGLAQRALVFENRHLIADLTSLSEHLEELVWDRTKQLEKAHAELLRRHEQLAEAHHRLQELDLLKGKFITITSHELVTPLCIIRGFSDMLTSVLARSPEKLEMMARILNQNVDRLTAIVADITDIARLRERKLEFRKDRVPLRAVVDRVAGEVGALLDQRRLGFDVEIPPDLPPVVGDANRIDQVLSNLVLNAIRFTPDGGGITVAARPDAGTGGMVEVTVSDTGIGIDEEQFGRIFDEFYEAAPSEQHHSGTVQFQSGGLGLGLAVARDIVQGHGGRIWVSSPRSQGGVGSTFHVLLPSASLEHMAGENDH